MLRHPQGPGHHSLTNEDGGAVTISLSGTELVGQNESDDHRGGRFHPIIPRRPHLRIELQTIQLHLCSSRRWSTGSHWSILPGLLQRQQLYNSNHCRSIHNPYYQNQNEFHKTQEIASTPPAPINEPNTDPPPYAEAVQSSNRWNTFRNSFHKQKKNRQAASLEPGATKQPILEPEG